MAFIKRALIRGSGAVVAFTMLITGLTTVPSHADTGPEPGWWGEGEEAIGRVVDTAGQPVPDVSVEEPVNLLV